MPVTSSPIQCYVIHHGIRVTTFDFYMSKLIKLIYTHRFKNMIKIELADTSYQMGQIRIAVRQTLNYMHFVNTG